MALTESIRPTGQKVPEDRCPHCSSGFIYEPTEDTLEDEASQCFMCFGTTRKMSKEDRKAFKNDRELDAQWSCLQRADS